MVVRRIYFFLPCRFFYKSNAHMNIYKKIGLRPVKTVAEMKSRMGELGATHSEQEETACWVRLFLAWCR
jgi:hypothetical protein